MTVRLLSRNSSAIAERVRRGELEAGLVLLPIDDRRLDVRPLVRDELLYVSADPERTRRPATIGQLASAPLIFYDAESADTDPIRRLLAERAQAHGVRLRPRVEVEMAELALAMVARGLGDTYLPVSYTHAPYYPAGLTTAPFEPTLFNTFAIVTRPAARLSPGTRELLGEIQSHMHAVAGEFDRGSSWGRRSGGLQPDAVIRAAVARRLIHRSRPAVRRAEIADAEAIGRLLHDFNREFDEPTPGPGAVAERVRALLAAGEMTVLLGGAGPDGLAVLRFRPAVLTDGLECYLEDLYVAPGHRGHGLGRALMEAALDVARGEGAIEMHLGTSEDDVAARALYESLGFSNREGGPDGPVNYFYEREL